jgi:hypothetical protein
VVSFRTLVLDYSPPTWPPARPQWAPASREGGVNEDTGSCEKPVGSEQSSLRGMSSGYLTSNTPADRPKTAAAFSPPAASPLPAISVISIRWIRTCQSGNADYAIRRPVKCASKAPSAAIRIPDAVSWLTRRPFQPCSMAHSFSERSQPTTCQRHDPAGEPSPPTA